MLDKREVVEVMQTAGEVRTATLQTDASYVVKITGKTGLREIEDNLRKLGHPIEYEKMRAMDWCPLGLRILSLLTIKDTFNWEDEEVRNMGYTAPAYSFITKMFMRALASPKAAFNRAPIYWSSHYSEGKIEVKVPDDTNYVEFAIRDFRGHPILCKHIEGYLERAGQFVLPKQKVSMRETKCIFRGDKYHQYELSW